MPETDLALSACFVAVLYAATKDRPGQFRWIDNCAAPPTWKGSARSMART
jgi:hypothetical protein